MSTKNKMPWGQDNGLTEKINQIFFSYIKKAITDTEFDLWFSDIKIGHLGKHLILFVDSLKTKKCILTHYLELIRDAVDVAGGANFSFQIDVINKVDFLYDSVELLTERIEDIKAKIKEFDAYFIEKL